MVRFSIATTLALTMGYLVSPAHATPNKDGESAGQPMCPMMDEPASLAISTPTDDGPVYFCCKGCISKFQKDPGKYAIKVAAQRKVLADRAKIQVTCPVTKEPIDQKVSVESNGKKVYFCCKGCAGKYQKDPAKYASALANGYTFQTKCPVMGGTINPTVSTTLSTGETIYYCCPMCDKSLRDDPAQYNKNLASQGILVNWADVKKADDKKGHEGHDHGAHGHGGHDDGGH